MWAQGTNSILEMRVVNMDMASYIIKTLEKSLVTAEREKTVSTKKLDFSSCVISPFFRRIGWPAIYQGGGQTEAPGQTPRHQVVATLLQDMRLCT